MELTRVLLTNYLPYAKSTIVERAIPFIDGLKPAQRRTLYTMYKQNLLGKDKNRAKCSKIIGAVMAIHPHGDSSIYEALVNMTQKYDGMSVPYIDGKGSFGNVYNKVGASAPRYTEARLAPICDELFANIREDAVDFVDNFDGTEKEPVMLPVTFPNVLVNSVAGVAVGTSSYIPSFPLERVCDSTIGILKGKINNAGELAKVLGIPEFTTGGHLHADEATLVKLCETGKASFHLSGSVVSYPNKIVITEIPYNTTAEDIIESVTKYAKSGELREVSDINDTTGINGFKMIIDLKKGSNSREVVKKLARLTPLRTRISFRTRVIIDDRCKEIGLLELLNQWIKFREDTIIRIYNFKKTKAEEQEHLLSTWEKVQGHIIEVVELISKNVEAKAKELLMSKYNLDETQCEYLLDFKLRQITEDRAKKSLQNLADTRANLAYFNKVVTEHDERVKIMLDDLERVKKQYKIDIKTQRADLVIESEDKIEKAPINDEVVRVILTENGYIKRLTTTREMMSYIPPEGDKIIRQWGVKNNDHLLVFTYDGTVHKILVDSIDAGRQLKETLHQKVNLVSKNDIMFVDNAGDYSGYFNLVYPNGRGIRINYSKANGNRKKYISLYEPVQPGNVFLTKSDKFFIITQRMKAAYVELKLMGQMSNRMAFKVARISSGDNIIGILDYEKMPAPKFIDFERYNKSYTVKIGDDVLWKNPTDVTTGTMYKQADNIAEAIISKYSSGVKTTTNVVKTNNKDDNEVDF